MPTLVITKKDEASVTMCNVLLETYQFEPTGSYFQGREIYKYKNFDLIVLDRTLHVYADYLIYEYPSDLYIFLSKHASETEIPCLTVHTPGNFLDAQFGGKPREVCISPAIEMFKVLKELSQKRKEIQVCYEVTHHGPTFPAPTMFVEIGSSIEYWTNEELAKFVVRCVIEGINKEIDCEVSIGVGDGHYAPKFTDIALKNNIAFGHMISKHLIKYLDEEMLEMAYKNTYPTPKYLYSRVENDLIKNFAEKYNLVLKII
jgi:D-aminoacyl-tRNA deacylase